MTIRCENRLMNKELYAEKLSWFKQNEKPEAVLLVADNPERIRLVIAWTNVSVNPAGNMTELKGESENEIWEWLWENTLFSKKELSAKIGISLSEFSLQIKIMPLIGNRVIYPDGTINLYVQRYLREQVVKLFEVKPKKSTRKDGR
jgi:hypothetical protein